MKLIINEVYCAVMAVAPSMGAWIEIQELAVMKPVFSVAPSMGAWIEIDFCLAELRDSKGRSQHGSVD